MDCGGADVDDSASSTATTCCSNRRAPLPRTSLGYFLVTQSGTRFIRGLQRIAIDHNVWVIIPTLLGFFILLRLVPRWPGCRAGRSRSTSAARGFAIPSVIHGQLLPH